MKKILLCVCVLSLAACKSNDLRSIADIADTVSDIAGTNDSSPNVSTGQPGYSHPDQQYSVKPQTFYITDATRMNPELGQIRTVITEKNPTGMTKFRIEGYHLDSGAALQSEAYLYAISPEGWLNEKAVKQYRADTALINSGTYYLKARSKQGNFYASGNVTLTPGVTNVIIYDLQ